MKLPDSQEADDTTLICKNTTSLRESVSTIEDFCVISGLKLNNTKTKAISRDISIGSLRNNKIKPLMRIFYETQLQMLGTINQSINQSITLFLCQSTLADLLIGNTVTKQK